MTAPHSNQGKSRPIASCDRARYLPTGSGISHRQVSPFVVACVPSTTRSTQTSRHCLAADIARPCGRLSTWTPLPHYGISRSRVTSTWRLPRHREPTPAAAAVPALVIRVALTVTWLVGIRYPPSFGCVDGRQAATVSVRRANDFKGQKQQAPPYPPANDLRHRRSSRAATISASSP